MPWLAVIIIIVYAVSMLFRAGKVAKNRPGGVRVNQKATESAKPIDAEFNTHDERSTVYDDMQSGFSTVRNVGNITATGSGAGVRTYRRGALNAKSMRKAMIVSEIISKPVSMRGE